MRIQRVAVRGEREAGQLDLLPRLTADARARQLNPTPTQRDLARRRARAARLAIGVAFPARSAQRGAVLLHHGIEDLLARADAQLEVRAFDTGERAQHGQGNLHGRGRRPLHGLEDDGTSWHASSWRWLLLGWLPPPYHTKGEEAAALTSENQQVLGQSLRSTCSRWSARLVSTATNLSINSTRMDLTNAAANPSSSR